MLAKLHYARTILNQKFSESSLKPGKDAVCTDLTVSTETIDPEKVISVRVFILIFSLQVLKSQEKYI